MNLDQVRYIAGVEVRSDGSPVDSYEQIDHPKHYNSHPAGIECIDVIEHWPHNIGAAVKYLWRAGLKPGTDTLTDLRKAAWYVAREISRLEKEAAP
jgi:hypothetical protein